jgi:hypothetical protein
MLSFCDDFDNNINPYRIWLCEITLGYCYFVMKIYIYIASYHFCTLVNVLRFAKPSFDFLPPYTPQKKDNIITMSQLLDYKQKNNSYHITLQKKDNNTLFGAFSLAFLVKLASVKGLSTLRSSFRNYHKNYHKIKKETKRKKPQ